MPCYFSGTNCRADGSVVPNSGRYITFAQLSINGTIVKTYTQPTGEPPPLLVSIGVRFDSTHFEPDAYVSVKVEGWDDAFNYYFSYDSSMTRNRAVSYAHSELVYGASGFWGMISELNFTGSVVDGGDWTTSGLIADMGVCSVLFVASHGNEYFHWDDQDSPFYAVPGPAHTFDYENARIGHIGTGLPPYNSTWAPPITVGYLYACNCGDTDAFTTVLWPYWNAYGDLVTDQCVFAYTCYVPVSKATEHAELLFGPMAEGKTAAISLGLFNENALAEDLQVWDVSPTQFDVDSRNIEAGDLALYGDGYSRLTTVYTGSNSSPNGWYSL